MEHDHIEYDPDLFVEGLVGHIMRDGCIVHEHTVGTPFEEDLAAFRRSGLGKAILAGGNAALAQLGPDEQTVLRRLLEGVV